MPGVGSFLSGHLRMREEATIQKQVQVGAVNIRSLGLPGFPLCLEFLSGGVLVYSSEGLKVHQSCIVLSRDSPLL